MQAQASAGHYTLNAQPLADLQRSAKAGDPGSLRAVAKQFESMLLTMMMKDMRASAGTSPLDSAGSKLFTEMLDQEYAQKIANGKGIGLADALVAQLSRPQIHTVDAEAQPKGILLHPDSKAGGHNQGLPGAAQTPIPLAKPQKTDAIPLAPRHYQPQTLLDSGKLLGSA